MLNRYELATHLPKRICGGATDQSARIYCF